MEGGGVMEEHRPIIVGAGNMVRRPRSCGVLGALLSLAAGAMTSPLLVERPPRREREAGETEPPMDEGNVERRTSNIERRMMSGQGGYLDRIRVAQTPEEARALFLEASRVAGMSRKTLARCGRACARRIEDLALLSTPNERTSLTQAVTPYEQRSSRN
jgi:hypothetical protein